MSVPVPPADRSRPTGEQYREWLAEVMRANPTVKPDDPNDRPIPFEGYGGGRGRVFDG